MNQNTTHHDRSIHIAVIIDLIGSLLEIMTATNQNHEMIAMPLNTNQRPGMIVILLSIKRILRTGIKMETLVVEVFIMKRTLKELLVKQNGNAIDNDGDRIYIPYDILI